MDAACQASVQCAFHGGLSNVQADREWYDQEEGGMVDDTHNPFMGDEAKFAQREAELQKKLVNALSQRTSPSATKFNCSACNVVHKDLFERRALINPSHLVPSRLWAC